MCEGGGRAKRPFRTPPGAGSGEPHPDGGWECREAVRVVAEGSYPDNGREYREAAGVGSEGNCPFEGGF